MARTEPQLDRSNPGKDCPAVFATSYRFGETHMLLFELFSVNRITKTHKPLGRAVCGDMLVYLDTPPHSGRPKRSQGDRQHHDYAARRESHGRLRGARVLGSLVAGQEAVPLERSHAGAFCPGRQRGHRHRVRPTSGPRYSWRGVVSFRGRSSTGDFSLHFAFIIGLSSSNGDLRPGSEMRRQYESVIFAFDEVVQQFDEDQLLPALAFGVRSSAGLISQPFVFLSAKGQPRVNGVQGVLEAYAQSFEHLFPSEPSELGPSITYVAQLAKQAPYQVALVLTDGKLDYGLSTLDCLSKASECAMSVVLLVIGGEGCSRTLRRDLLSRRRAGLRECVHVVEVAPYRDRLHLLPGEALLGVPEQVVQYLALHDVEPALGVQ
ncbi:hypothetical protein HPB50_004737 [Hyalomma asiaticum]|uniref:Uncharacterized protein n=1 Tax=Hyalomma asiaticum TaxID=266040 RepID=A0ACB7SAB4_HYAAI|nr:hypothetical protein HPB50_004737 [Hyalomma asiaticum]